MMKFSTCFLFLCFVNLRSIKLLTNQDLSQEIQLGAKLYQQVLLHFHFQVSNLKILKLFQANTLLFVICFRQAITSTVVFVNVGSLAIALLIIPSITPPCEL